MKNPKTTLTGIITIVVALLLAAKTWLETGQVPDLGALVSALVSGIGLIVAADGKDKSAAVDGVVKALMVFLLFGFLFLSGCAGIARVEYKDPHYGTAAFEWKATETSTLPTDKGLQK